jgi:hypothetical protein
VSVAQFLVTAALAILVTLPAVLLIPRARQSPMFDRVLWIGTWFLAFLSAWFVLGNVNLPGLNGLVIGEVSVIPALIGAAVGAFLLNGLLWSMDFFSRPPLEEDAAPEESNGTADTTARLAGEPADSDDTSADSR